MAQALDDDTVMIVPAGRERLAAMLTIPQDARGVVIFANGYGQSTWRSPAQRALASAFRAQRLGTFLVELVDDEEARGPTGGFEPALYARRLADRLGHVSEWLARHRRVQGLPVGCFASGVASTAAWIAASRAPGTLRAIVSRGGWPEVEADRLGVARVPTLVLLSREESARDDEDLGLDDDVDELTHSGTFTAPGEHLQAARIAGEDDEVTRLACDWFLQHFLAPPRVHRSARRFGALLGAALAAFTFAACDPPEPPLEDETLGPLPRVSADEPPAAADGREPESATRGAYARPTPLGHPSEDLSEERVRELCGAGCSGTVCVTDTERCDCVPGGNACEVGVCRADDSCADHDRAQADG